MTILITEDDHTIENVFSRILMKAGYHVALQQDGMAIIEDRFELPDLFIIDKQLAGVSGLDVCHHLKRQSATRHIPVIMVSASPNCERLAKAAGADQFLEKPFAQKALLEMVRRCLMKE